MNPARKGANVERELRKILRKKGFNAFRVRGSRGAGDVLSLYKGKAFVFQVKYTKYEKLRISRFEIRRLVDLYYRHNPDPSKEVTFVYLAVKFRRIGWRFYHIIQLWSILSGIFETIEINHKDGMKFEDFLSYVSQSLK